MEADLRRIRNVAEENVLEIGIGGLDDLVCKCSSKRLALVMDHCVIGAREVDALEHAGTMFGQGETVAELRRAVRLDHQHLAGRQRLHVVERAVEGRLDGGTLRRDDDHFVCHIVEARSNPVRIANGERRARRRGTDQRERAVRPRQRLLERRLDRLAVLEIVGDELRHQVTVRLAGREEAEAAVLFEQLVRIGQVEVAGEEQRTLQCRGDVHERMTEIEILTSKCRISEMSEEDRLVRRRRTLRDLSEKIGERLRGNRLQDAIRRRAWLGLQAEHRRTGAILSAIVLFLQQKRQFHAAKVTRTVFVTVKRRALAQTQKRHATFVLKIVGHKCQTISTIRANARFVRLPE